MSQLRLPTSRSGASPRRSWPADNQSIRRAGGSGASSAKPTEIDLAMMRRAIELGRKAAARGEVPVGAVVYRGSQIIAECANNREEMCDPVGHAELLALSMAGKKLGTWRLNDCSLAVTLEPCPMCAGALVNSRLARLIYGVTDPKAGACDTLFSIPTDSRLNHRVEVIAPVLEDDCRELLQSFFRQRRAEKKSG